MFPDLQISTDRIKATTRMADVVDAIVHDLLHGLNVAAHTDALKAYGPLATPRLLHHLQQPHAHIALFALQHCWTPEASEPVTALLASDNATWRKMAAMVLARQAGLDELAARCEPLVDDPRSDVAGFALEQLERERPDLRRALHAAQRPELWDALWKYLPRYHSPELTPVTLRMMPEGRGEVCVAAMVSLIHQNARSPEPRESMAVLLTHEMPHVREIAAEYLLWHGAPQQFQALRTAVSVETDPFAKASIQAAAEIVAQRSGSAADWDAGAPPASGETPDYVTALQSVKDDPCPEVLRAAFRTYARAEEFEPHWAYRGQDVPEEWVRARAARFDLQARLFDIPANVALTDGLDRAPFSAPTAREFLPPVRHFFDPTRTSYGRDMEDSPDGFGGMIHVGDDAQWNRDHRSVIAVAAGQVRQVQCVPTWGFIVVVEHALPALKAGRASAPAGNERFCSLYAHLSPFVCVKPGQIVAAGQKIGAIGRSFTWENGGYAAHLHFGIHRGPFWAAHVPGKVVDVRWRGTLYRGKVLRSDPDLTYLEIHTARGPYMVTQATSWVRGYISKQTWDDDRHGWEAPQEFLQRLMN